MFSRLIALILVASLVSCASTERTMSSVDVKQHEYLRTSER